MIPFPPPFLSLNPFSSSSSSSSLSPSSSTILQLIHPSLILTKSILSTPPTNSTNFDSSTPRPANFNPSSSSSRHKSSFFMFSLNQKTYLLLAIIILSIIFFLCGILRLLVKFLLRPIGSESEDTAPATTFQGQLQQLFHLHDEGVDQSFIDALPLFFYRSVIGLKDPFDCVVCLCEFELQDKLRLLPNCSHAFHMECIDAWLLSHSTCPLCRRSLFLEIPIGGSGDPDSVSDEGFGNRRSEELNPKEVSRRMEIPLMQDRKRGEAEDGVNVRCVKLGKIRNVGGGGGGGGGEEEGTSGDNGDLKERCFSMGAIEYVMNERSVLRVAIEAPRKQSNRINEGFPAPTKMAARSRRERGGGGGDDDDDCSRRAFSLRWPKHTGDLGLDLEAGRRWQKSMVVGHG